MAAVTTALFELLKAGDHLVLTSDCYRRTRQFVGRFLGRLGIESTLVEPGDEKALRAALRPGRTKVILTESPTNPYLRIADLPLYAKARDACPGANLIVDATFATPINQRPLTQGVDLVVHSATKYLGGHNDLLAGAVCGRSGLVQAIKDLRGVLGRVLGVRQMRGFGGVVSFRLRGDERRASRFVDACKLATIAPSLGGVETLIEQPAIMSYFELTTEEREAIGIFDDLIRLSVGIEDAEDIAADLLQALAAALADWR